VDDLIELSRHPDEMIIREISDLPRNMSERAIRNIHEGLTDSGANIGIASRRNRDTNPFSENLADEFSRFPLPRLPTRQEQNRSDEFSPLDIEEEFIRTFYLNPQESMHYVD